MAETVSGRHSAKQYCDPCSMDGQQTEAEGYCGDCAHFLCAECYSYHRKPIPSRHHEITKDLTPVSRNDVSKTNESIFVSEICNEHRQEVIKFHCMSHDRLGCGTCMMLNHRTCKTVYIPDVASSPDFEQEQGKLINKLDKLEKEFSDSLDQADLNIPEVNRLFVDTTKDFLTFKNDITNQLTHIGKEIEEKTSEIRDNDIRAMESIVERCKKSKEEVHKIKTTTQVGAQLGAKQYIHIKQTGYMIKQWKRSLDEIQSELGIQKYEFQPTIDLKSDGSIGKLAIFDSDSDDEGSDATSGSWTEGSDTEDLPSPNLSVHDLNNDNNDNSGGLEEQTALQDSHVRDILAKAPSDFEKMEMSGIALVTESKLVVIDKANQNVKLVDIKKNKVVDELKVRYMIYNMWEPYGITAVDGNQVAVTCPDRQKVQIIKVKKSLSEGSSFKVGGHCYGIAYDSRQQAFIITFADPVKVEMVDKTGNTIRVLLPVPKAQDLFAHPNYAVLTADGKRLYVSDSEKSTVTRIDIDGDMTTAFVYNPGTSFDPHGLTVDKHGRVYVCDMSHDNVHCLSAECEIIEVIAGDKKRFPTCLTYSNHDDVFYMCSSLEKIVMLRIQ